MSESQSYRDVQRKILSQNPYFHQHLVKVRQKLGIPEIGFDAAVQELDKDIPHHPSGFALGKPDVAKLKQDARRLGLPLEDLLNEWRDRYSQRGIDFGQVIEKLGWGALPIWGFALSDWWLAQERKAAGLEPSRGGDSLEFQQMIPDLPPGVATVLHESLNPPLDSRLPSVQAGLWLVREYRLGEDYAPTMSSIVLGCPPGGGAGDIVIWPRWDGTGITVVLNCVRYDTTVSEWQRLFLEVIQPTLFHATGKLPSGVPFPEALKDARKRARPGRPPYTPEVLSNHMRMWEFCYQQSYISKGRIGVEALNAFLESLPDDDPEKPQFERLDLETFRRSVGRLDKLMRPTGSAPDF